MINGKTIGIDARMIEMSGIGTYIQHLMGQGIYDYAVGNEDTIRKYDHDVKVIAFDAPIYGLKEQFLYPVGKIRKADISIMHFPHYSVPMIYRRKFVVTVHDLTHIILPELLGNRIKYYYAKLLMRNALSKASHVFTDSENSRSDIKKHFKTDDSKISIAYPAVDGDFRVKDNSEILYLYDKFNIPKEKKVILYVGNLKPHKNLATLLKAFQIMEREDAVLVLAGKAFKSIDLEAQEQSMGISDKVIHTGLVSKEELIDLYNLADVFVFPSLYEGFGLPPLEAMACGTPVVAADNSSVPEVVGDAALMVDAHNYEQIEQGIDRILSDDAYRKKLIDKGNIRCKVFDWERTAEDIRIQFKKLCR